MSKLIFISLPMRDRELDEIHDDIDRLYRLITNEFPQEDCQVINTIWTDDPPTDIYDPGVWYLGKSVSALAEADLVVFHPNWREARGCIIEHMICALYNIPYVDVSMDYSEDDEPINDYTHDWDIAGEVNAELSEKLAEVEGLDDILDDEDVEDALGFEHDDVDDLIESDPDLNPYAQHSDIDIAVVDEFDENGNVVDSDILKPGEYDADLR